MSKLRPTSFAALAGRLFRELAEKNAAFDLPARRFVRGEADLDLSVRLGAGAAGAGAIGGRRAAVPFGPAAGPHTQMAQNMVLSWLAGGRVLELKTVQVDDELAIPRPCIDMREVGYNCEFSQELRVGESLREYVKGALLIAMLAESGRAGVLPGFTDTTFDASAGYDLAGVTSAKVDGYLRALGDVRPILEELRREIEGAGGAGAGAGAGMPAEVRALAGVEVPAALVETVTVSTFHGCPAAEIERIAEHLMERHRLSVVVKLNPTLLGRDDLHALLHGPLGFTDVEVPAGVFERDLRAEQAFEMVGRLRERAAALGVGFGVKLTNTLVVENRRPFFPGDVKEAYLSGPPLHVLAMALVERLRDAAGMELPLSFSGGIDAHNVADAIALDLVPVTVCTDWLKTGGYGRGIRFHEALVERVRHAGATTREGFVLRAFGNEERALAAAGVGGEAAARALAALRRGERFAEGLGEAAAARWVREAARLNTKEYVARIVKDPRYARGHHEKAPKKVGSALTTFDCLTCDKCVAVCPNDALFTYVAPHLEVPVSAARAGAGERAGAGQGQVQEIGNLETVSLKIASFENASREIVTLRTGTLRIDERHQIACFADQCNDCGNCDAFCPEDGGPNIAKPRLFGSLAALREDARGEGLFVEPRPGGYRAALRSGGREGLVEADGPRVRYSGPGFAITFDLRDPEATVEGEIEGEVDLTAARVAHVIATSVLSPREVNPVTALAGAGTRAGEVSGPAEGAR